MKTLYIVRHAKSSWKEHGTTDFDRPLNKRGERDAPHMGKVLKSVNIIPDIVYSSPAKRAITTCRIMCDELGYEEDRIIQSQSIYEAGIGNLMDIINSIPDKHNSAMLFGHNPGLTMLVNYLSNKHVDNIPTCGAVKINFDVTTWETIADRAGKIEFFEYPKKYFE